MSRPLWLRERFQRQFATLADYLDWIGQETQVGGQRAIQGVRVTLAYLDSLQLTEPEQTSRVTTSKVDEMEF